jgi:hypothetical protein
VKTAYPDGSADQDNEFYLSFTPEQAMDLAECAQQCIAQ